MKRQEACLWSVTGDRSSVNGGQQLSVHGPPSTVHRPAHRLPRFVTIDAAEGGRMKTGNEKRQRRRSTRVRRPTKADVAEEPTFANGEAGNEEARAHYRREKARRAARSRHPEHPLEQARRAYDALLAADAERAKGGRPRKMTATPAPKAASSDHEAENEE